MPVYSIVFNGYIAQFEPHWSGGKTKTIGLMDKSTWLPQEIVAVASMDEARTEFAKYIERMKTEVPDLIKQRGLTGKDPACNGFHAFMEVKDGQRKPRGWGKHASISYDFEFPPKTDE